MKRLSLCRPLGSHTCLSSLLTSFSLTPVVAWNSACLCVSGGTSWMMKPLPLPQYRAGAYTHVHTHGGTHIRTCTTIAHNDIIPQWSHKVLPVSLVLLPAEGCSLFRRPGVFIISATQLGSFLLLLTSSLGRQKCRDPNGLKRERESRKGINPTKHRSD